MACLLLCKVRHRPHPRCLCEGLMGPCGEGQPHTDTQTTLLSLGAALACRAATQGCQVCRVEQLIWLSPSVHPWPWLAPLDQWACPRCPPQGPGPSWSWEQGGSRRDTPVVVLTDLSHGHQGLQVLVGLEGVDVVQGAAVSGVTVGGREVDGHLWRPRNDSGAPLPPGLGWAPAPPFDR